MIVLADRYVYTAFSRDVARGVHPAWVRAVYSFAPRPDLALYFRVPIEVSLDRLLGGRAKLKYHEAGMDLGLAPDPARASGSSRAASSTSMIAWPRSSSCAWSTRPATSRPSRKWSGAWCRRCCGLRAATAVGRTNGARG